MREAMKSDRREGGVGSNKKYKCCCCCHVRTGTIFLGTIQMVAQLLLLAMFVLVLRQPELLENGSKQLSIADQPLALPATQSGKTPVSSSGGGPLPTRLESNDILNGFIKDEEEFERERKLDLKGEKVFRATAFGFAHNYSIKDIEVGVVVTACVLLITALMMFGALCGRAAFILPFFCLQVFDFCLTVLTAISLFSYPDLRTTLKYTESSVPMMSDCLMKVDDESLLLIVFILFSAVIVVKAYLMGVVWRCYKFLVEKQSGQNCEFEEDGGRYYIDNDTQVLLPPAYESLTDVGEKNKVEDYTFAPPAYTSAA